MALGIFLGILVLSVNASILSNTQLLFQHFHRNSPFLLQTHQDDLEVEETTTEEELITRDTSAASFEGMVCVCMSSDEVDFKELDGDENGEDDEVDVEVDEEFYMNEDGSPFEDESECADNIVITLECVGNDCVITDSSNTVNFEMQTVSLDECLDEIDLVVVDQPDENAEEECNYDGVTIDCSSDTCTVTDTTGTVSQECLDELEALLNCEGDDCSV